MPSKKDIIIFYALSFTWGLIWSLVGLFVLLFIYIFMKKQVVIRPIAGRISVVFKEKYFGGVSLGVVYLTDASDRSHTHMHELGHTVQNMMFGPFFILLVAIPSGIWYQYRNIARYFGKKNLPPYDSPWFEAQATDLGYKKFHDAVMKRGSI